MAYAKVTGLNDSQTKIIHNVLCAIPHEKSPEEDYEIDFIDAINVEKQHSIWYCGAVANIKYKDSVFSLYASGTVRASLYDKLTGEELVRVVDKNDAGDFKRRVEKYLTSDSALLQAWAEDHEKYILKIEEGNWWDISVQCRDRKEEWADDDCQLLNVIVALLQNIDETINHL